MREAADEFKAMIRQQYPNARFQLVRAADQQRSWHLRAMVDADDPDEVGDLVSDREIDMLVEERISIHVIPLPRRESAIREHDDARRRVS